MKAVEVTLKDFFKNGVTYITPSFQRPYDWRGADVRKYLSAVQNHVSGGFFCGSIVGMKLTNQPLLLKDEPSSVQQKLLLIDGNHRLITTLVCLLVVRDLLKGYHSDAVEKINNTIFFNLDSNGSPHFKYILPRYDRPVFEALVKEQKIPSKASSILRAYKFIFDELREVQEPMLRSYCERIFVDFSFVLLTLEEDEDPYPIFKLLSVPEQDFTQQGLREYNRFSDDPQIMALIAGGESSDVEFKERTLSSTQGNSKEPNASFSVLRTVAGFMNSRKGGILLIGVCDDGKPRGVESEYPIVDKGKSNRDGYLLYLNNVLRMRLSIENPFRFYSVELRTVQKRDVCVIKIAPATAPVYLDKHLFVRSGNQTIEMLGPDLVNYVNTRWPQQ
ncbi:MAG: DUF262 domain-containing protein [Kiritimatiellae bacterium]|nr:DUF262 domain-containing protein [Kiritimatiellia bacterium]